MNWVDILIIIVAAIGAYMGWKQGLIRTIFSFIGLIVGVVLAGLWAPGLAEELSSGSQWAYILAFTFILIIVLIIANITGSILKTFIKFAMMGSVDSVGGAFIGFLVGALVMAAVLASIGPYLDKLPIGSGSSLADAIGDSSLAEFFIDTFGLLLNLLPGESDAIKNFFN